MDSSQSDKKIKDYYKERAPVYDRVYAYSERQADLRYLENFVSSAFAGKDVLEVAAGTGYWTQFIGRKAKSVLATDATAEALAQVRLRDIRSSVETRVVDAYSLDEIGIQFNGAFAGLWFSHVPVERRAEWLALLQGCVVPGSTVLLLDNSKAQCRRLPLSYTDEHGNTYQDRETDSGVTYRLMKNFPTEAEMLKLVADMGSTHTFQELEHFWLLQYISR